MDIRNKITTLRALKSTLNVWGAIAVNRYKRLSSQVGATMSYFLRLQEVMEHLYSLYSGVRAELLEMRDESSIDILVLTSDRGYVGDFILKTLRVLDAVLEAKKNRKVSLFIAGGRGALSKYRSLGAVIYENVLTKDINWGRVEEIRKKLVDRYRRRVSDATYVVFQRPEVDMGGRAEPTEEKAVGEIPTESPFFYARFEEVLRAKPLAVVERGRSRPIVVRFLPADVRKRYSPTTILNLEGNEDRLIEELLELYLDFFMREVFLEHFTSLNFARYRTVTRIKENIDRRLSEYQRLMNKLRQEKITKEIEDIVLSHMATEERIYRDILEEGYLLEVDINTPEPIVSLIKERLEGMGYRIREIRKANLLGGFRLLSTSKVADPTALRYLMEITRFRGGI